MSATVKIAEATMPQLRKFAGGHLGITFEFGVTLAKARAAVMAAHEGDVIPDLVAAQQTIASEAHHTSAPPAELDEAPEAKLSAAPATSITAAKSTPVKRRQKKKAAGEAPGDDEPPHMIHIMEQEGTSGADPVAVSVNGKAMLIPRGSPQKVPWKYVHVLHNAVEVRYTQARSESGETLSELIPRNVLSYPFQDLGSVAA